MWRPRPVRREALSPITGSAWITKSGRVILSGDSTHAEMANKFGLCDKGEFQKHEGVIRSCMQALHRGHIRVVVTNNGVTFQASLLTAHSIELIRAGLLALTKEYPVYEVDDARYGFKNFHTARRAGQMA